MGPVEPILYYIIFKIISYNIISYLKFTIFIDTWNENAWILQIANEKNIIRTSYNKKNEQTTTIRVRKWEGERRKRKKSEMQTKNWQDPKQYIKPVKNYT